MKVAVVTPYYRESDEVLSTCLDSVRAQTHKDCRHFMVSDGFPNALVDAYETTHVKLPAGHGDNGNAARCIGAFAAIADGFDAIAFLDADNWFRPDHIERLVALQARTGAALCTSGRSIHRLDGSTLIAQDRESDGVAFADTSCLCFFRPSFDLMPLWGYMPRSVGPVCDKIMWDAVRVRGISRAHDPEPTVAFRSQYAFQSKAAGETPPEGAKFDRDQQGAWNNFKALPTVQRMGLLLGLGGTQDLKWLHSVSPDAKVIRRDLTVAGVNGSLSLEMPDDDGIAFVGREIFVEQQYRPVLGLTPPRRILDIGANVGLAAAYFRLIYPNAHVTCIEPDPQTYKFLARNAKVIGNCAAICAGLTYGTQVRPFYIASSSVLNTSLSGSGQQSARLLMIDAERLLNNMPKQGYDLIKIDTEGAELPIMLSMRKRLAATPVILIEFHSDADRRAIDALLCETHVLWHSTVTSPHRGNLCYALRVEAEKILRDQPLI
jgi:FkbM family methyltransferase